MRNINVVYIVAGSLLACGDPVLLMSPAPPASPMLEQAQQPASAGVAGFAGVAASAGVAAPQAPMSGPAMVASKFDPGGSAMDAAKVDASMPLPMAGREGSASGAAGAEGAAHDAGESANEGVPLSAATKAWWAYERAASFDAAVSDISVPMRDGVLLACSLSRPARGAEPAPGKFPGLVVEYTPYALIVDIMIAEAAFFAKRGYNALVCHVRGTGLSGGTWNHAASRQDGLDASDQIEWLATQPFADGRIGQFGGSYGGFTSYQAAAEQPPHLLAVAPMIPPGSLYHDVIYPGGIKSTERGNIDAWPVTAEVLSLGKINADAEYEMNRAHPTFDAYWQERSMIERVASIQVPILTIGAWEDANFRAGALANIEAGLDKTWAIYGQWPHRSPVAFEANCDSCVPEPLPSGVLLAWFDHWVHQLPDVPLPLQPVFISEEGPRGVGQGFRELAWNAATSGEPSYQLGSDNTLSPVATSTETITFREPAEPKDPGGSVTFTTAPLAHDQLLVGHPALQLRASLSAADANFYVELLDVAASGEEMLVNDGFLKASHRDSHITPEPVVAREARDYLIAIRADHHRFVAGHSLRIRISGGDSMSLVPPTEPVEISLQTGEFCTLRMPQSW